MNRFKKVFFKTFLGLGILLISLQIIYYALRVTVMYGPYEGEEGRGYGSVEYYKPFDPDKPTKAELEAAGFVKGEDGVYREKR